VSEATRGLVGDGDDDQDQRRAVGHRGKDPHPVVAVRPLGVGWATRLDDGEPGQAEGDHVGEDVAGVGEQRQRVRDQAGRRLDDKDQGGQEERLPESSPGQVAVVVVAQRFSNQLYPRFP